MITYIKIFSIAGTYDQVNGGGVWCLEPAARRVSAIMDAYKTGKPNWSTARLFTAGGDEIDSVPQELKRLVTRKAKDENDFEQVRARARSAYSGAGAQGGSSSTDPNDFHDASAAGAPAGATAAARGRARGRGGGRGRAVPPAPPG